MIVVVIVTSGVGRVHVMMPTEELEGAAIVVTAKGFVAQSICKAEDNVLL